MSRTPQNKQEIHCIAISEDPMLHKILGRHNTYSVCRTGKFFWAYALVSEIDNRSLDLLADYCSKRILTFCINPHPSNNRVDKIAIKIKPTFSKWNRSILDHRTTRSDVQFYNENAQSELQKELTSKTNDKKRRLAVLSSLARVKGVLREYDCTDIE